MRPQPGPGGSDPTPVLCHPTCARESLLERCDGRAEGVGAGRKVPCIET